MQKNTCLITGAGKGLGEQFVHSMRRFCPDMPQTLVDVDGENLHRVGDATGAQRRIICDLFTEGSSDYEEVMKLHPKVAILNAARNADELKPKEERLPSRLDQFASMSRFLSENIRNRESGAVDRQLIVVVCSIAAILGEELEFARETAVKERWHYSMMKRNIHDLFRQIRPELEEQGIDLSVLYPGSMNTGLTTVQDAFNHANGFGKKVKDYRGRKNLRQERILEPREISDPVAHVIQQWMQTGLIPEKYKEWIMLDSLRDFDMYIQAETEQS